MVAIVHAPRRPTILVALVAALGLAGAARAVRHRHHHHGDREARVSLRAAHHRCLIDHRITDQERLRDVQTRIESGRTAPGINDDVPPRAER